MSAALLGIGVDAQYFDHYPGGIAGLCAHYRDRLSHVSVVSIADLRTATAFREECVRELPTIHHLPGVAPADPDGPHLAKMAGLEEITHELRAQWICEDIGIWSIGPYPIPYFSPPIFELEVADKVADGICRIEELSSVPFLAELPSCAFVVGRATMGEFFERIVERAGCDLVADVSHVYSYALARERRPSDILDTLPLDHVREVHISGGHVDHRSPRRFMDTHSELVPDAIVDVLVEAVERCPRLEAVTYEVGVGLDAGEIAHDFDRIQQALQEAGWAPRIGRRTAEVSDDAR